MKRTFYILLLVLGLIPATYGQNYLQPGSQWRINATGLSMSAECYFTEQYVCEITGDSLVSGQIYKKINCHGLKTEGPTSPNPWSNCQPPTTFNHLYALVRQEGLKLYIYDNPEEKLLYDFDLQVGDTLPLSYNNYDNQVTIDSITTIQIGNEVRNVFHFTQQNQSFEINKIIEGVGHNWGFIGTMQPFEFFETSLECFAINDTTYYPSLGAPCELNVGLSEEPDIVLLTASPNPTDATMVIETGMLGEIHRLDMVDIYGNQCSFKESNSDAGIVKLNLSTAESGVYIVRIVGENGSVGMTRVVRL
ncbi:MAG: T9SS type A sorting domain-containing protein [Fluviicola sp.]|nr:T9SS type A sorting domain-containing protein [Fluviicola sp.]